MRHTDLENQLFIALCRMQIMHEMLMKKVNHGASFYNAECIKEMNEAPSQAAKAISAYRNFK